MIIISQRQALYDKNRLASGNKPLIIRTANTPGNRRHFLKTTAGLATGLTGLSLLPAMGFAQPLSGDLFGAATIDPPLADDLNIIGPKEGYSPQIGTLVSMMTWMRTVMLYSSKGMTTEQLDFLLDDKANTIGAMLFHLAATDAFYHEHTFKGIEWGKWDKSIQDAEWRQGYRYLRGDSEDQECDKRSHLK